MSEAAADLVKRLRAIADNDWRISFLAHTSDTANEAADRIVSQEAEIEKLREDAERWRSYVAFVDAKQLALSENTDDKG